MIVQVTLYSTDDASHRHVWTLDVIDIERATDLISSLVARHRTRPHAPCPLNMWVIHTTHLATLLPRVQRRGVIGDGTTNGEAAGYDRLAD